MVVASNIGGNPAPQRPFKQAAPKLSGTLTVCRGLRWGGRSRSRQLHFHCGQRDAGLRPTATREHSERALESDTGVDDECRRPVTVGLHRELTDEKMLTAAVSGTRSAGGPPNGPSWDRPATARTPLPRCFVDSPGPAPVRSPDTGTTRPAAP